MLPAYNAARTLQVTVDAIPKEWVDDILVVDDASADNTAEVARALGLRTIVHERNTGYGGNQKTCYRTALEMGADIAVMIHPDFQYDPYYIPELIRPLAFGKADVSIGSRMLVKRNALKGGMPWWKFLGNIFLTKIENIVLGLGLSEYHTGFRAYSRRALETMPFEKNSDDFVFDSEIIVQARIANFAIAETPIETKYFPEASSISFRRSVKYGFAILGVMVTYIAFRLGLRMPAQFSLNRRGADAPARAAESADTPSPALFFLVFLAIGFMFAYSFPTLTTKPRFGVDESMTLEVAHNIQREGVFNVSVAPGEYAKRPYTIAATGYAVTVPLASVFSVWGFGLLEARLYMIAWMLLFLFSVFWIVWNVFGRAAAVAALFLIVTFATFYDIGRTAMGELPGLVFFLWGAYLLAHRLRLSLAGILFGLAAATKPSLYMAAIPLLAVFFFLRRSSLPWRSMIQIAAGLAPPLLLWVLSVFPEPFSVVAWREALAFLQNPFGRPLLSNVIGNARALVTSTTLIYFYGVAALVAIMYRRERHTMPNLARDFSLLVLVYSTLGFLYFLRSPGWFRYLFAVEILLLVLFYPALQSAVAWARIRFSRLHLLPAGAPLALAAIFILVQGVHLFLFSTILSSDAPQVIGVYLNRELARQGGAVGIINNKQVAALVPAEARYQQFHWTGTLMVGTNPLALPEDKLPRLLFVADKDGPVFVEPYKDVFLKHYRPKQVFFGEQFIFERVR